MPEGETIEFLDAYTNINRPKPKKTGTKIYCKEEIICRT